eukprot:6570710-Heterocapsa_arctica.AAC.1
MSGFWTKQIQMASPVCLFWHRQGLSINNTLSVIVDATSSKTRTLKGAVLNPSHIRPKPLLLLGFKPTTLQSAGSA